MILNPAKAIELGWIENVDDPKAQVQQHGIDVRIEDIMEIISEGKLFINDKKLPDMKICNIHSARVKDNVLSPMLVSVVKSNAYIINAIETVNIPKDVAAFAIMRSTLNRLGVPIHSALYDSGFRGKIQSTMYAFNDCEIEIGARYAQIIFIEAQSASLYKGQYQDQGLPSNVDKVDPKLMLEDIGPE